MFATCRIGQTRLHDPVHRFDRARRERDDRFEDVQDIPVGRDRIGLACRRDAAGRAKTLKWGANREIASLDPNSFGETFTLSV